MTNRNPFRISNPSTQYHLADALGVSAVHVNHHRKRREDGLAKFRDGQVTFENYDGLVALAQFDPAYLDQSRPVFR